MGTSATRRVREPDQWERGMRVNSTGTYLVARHAIPSDAGSGVGRRRAGLDRERVEHRGHRGHGRGSAHNASQAAVALLTKTMAIHYGVEEHALGRSGRPSEMAAAATSLPSRDASFVTGHMLVADGGYTAGRHHGITSMFGL